MTAKNQTVKGSTYNPRLSVEAPGQKAGNVGSQAMADEGEVLAEGQPLEQAQHRQRRAQRPRSLPRRHLAQLVQRLQSLRWHVGDKEGGQGAKHKASASALLLPAVNW